MFAVSGRKKKLALHIYTYRYATRIIKCLLPEKTENLHFFDFQGLWKCQGPLNAIMNDSGIAKLLKVHKQNGENVRCDVLCKIRISRNVNQKTRNGRKKTNKWVVKPSTSVWPILKETIPTDPKRRETSISQEGKRRAWVLGRELGKWVGREVGRWRGDWLRGLQ